MRLQPITIHYPDDSAFGSTFIECKATGKRLPWNQAARAGWVADLDGPAFNAFYSPEGAATLAENDDTCDGCIHRHYVRAHRCGSSSSGWGCLRSGGHAIKRCAGYATA